MIGVPREGRLRPGNHGWRTDSQALRFGGEGPGWQPFRFIGAIWDSSTGLYKMGERYYDPTLGRFTQLDPLGNGYVYSQDNPVNFSDSSGLSPGCENEQCGGGASMGGAGLDGEGAGPQLGEAAPAEGWQTKPANLSEQPTLEEARSVKGREIVSGDKLRVRGELDRRHGGGR